MARYPATSRLFEKLGIDYCCGGNRPLEQVCAEKQIDPEAVLEAKRRMHPIPRGGKLEEMGEMAVYLASDLAAFVTGQAIAIDGGYSTR